MIDKNSYMDFAARIYDNPSCEDVKEFEYDARRPLRIKFILRKWEEEGREIDVRRLLNHAIIMHNCFGKHAVNMISMYCENYLHYLLPFFDYLGYTPGYLSFEGKRIVTDHIDRDQDVKKILGNPF